MVTGAIPAYDDDFARAATARIDFGPHEAFGPPPEEIEPEPEPDAAHVFDRLRRIRSHARQKRKRGGRRWIGVVVVLVLFAAAAGLKYLSFSPWSSDEAAEIPADAPIPFHATSITAADVGSEGFLSWAYQDWRDPNAAIVGSENVTQTTQAASMIAVWLGADLLRRAAEQGKEPTEAERADIEAMIRDDDRSAAERVLNGLGGHAESIARLNAMCRLTETEPAQSWLEATISAQDAARLGSCVAQGTAAGAQWTPWLLNVMRQVRGSDGIREAFAPQLRPTIAIKYGVLLDPSTNEWRGNCLAIGTGWALAVLQRYPSTGDEAADVAHVDAVCEQVVAKLTGS
jgi:hypothetical protein